MQFLPTICYKKPIWLLLDYIHGETSWEFKCYDWSVISNSVKSAIPGNISLILFFFIYIFISLKKLHWGEKNKHSFKSVL